MKIFIDGVETKTQYLGLTYVYEDNSLLTIGVPTEEVLKMFRGIARRINENEKECQTSTRNQLMRNKLTLL